MQPVDVSIVVSDHDHDHDRDYRHEHDDRDEFELNDDVPTNNSTSSNSSSGMNGMNGMNGIIDHLTVETAYDEIEYFTYRAPRGTSGSESSSTDSASCASDSLMVQHSRIQHSADEDSNEYYNSYNVDDYIDGEDEYFEGDDGLLVDQGNGMILKSNDSEEGRNDTDYSYTVQCGWIVLFSTWIIFVLGVGSMFGVWKWVWAPALDEGSSNRSLGVLESVGIIDEVSDFPIEEYYPSMIMLLCVVAWIWCVVSWVGMKLFRHAKGGVSSDSAPQTAEHGTESPRVFDERG
ncbi:uncharacterized protein V1513DRAFT_467841 [Lipomyces chichibuensis]|uniref:uncharacterized protein n=1 Tax=Lipomyces chichibuensis TaxID=1546026 RepID=UPI0033431498